MLDRLNGPGFWLFAGASYLAGGYTLLQIVRLIELELWFRRYLRGHSPTARPSI